MLNACRPVPEPRGGRAVAREVQLVTVEEQQVERAEVRSVAYRTRRIARGGVAAREKVRDQCAARPRARARLAVANVRHGREPPAAIDREPSSARLEIAPAEHTLGLPTMPALRVGRACCSSRFAATING